MDPKLVAAAFGMERQNIAHDAPHGQATDDDVGPVGLGPSLGLGLEVLW